MEELITNIINYMGIFGYFSGFILIFLESIIAILPLSVFIVLNVMTYGTIIGFLISWLATVCGCMFAFYLSRKFSNFLNKKIKKEEQVKKIKKVINKISFTNLVILLAIPFTPAFLINLAAGSSDMSYRKFFFAVLIGKIPMVYFWGFIGLSLRESLTDITVLIKIVFMIVIAYLVSKVANSFLKEK